MRIVAPRVHVEVFRPTRVLSKSGNTKVLETDRFNPLYVPNEIRYIKTSVGLEDRRIKGIQFEETALFGGFIEINIAEDPQSEMFDNFLPNDHIEVFYNDTNEVRPKSEETFNWNLNVQKDYDYTNEVPKFQGATWKSDLKYSPTRVTTKLHAWDYLRILQYINIPKGERKDKYQATRVVAQPAENKSKMKATIQRQKYGDDMLDYIDSALNSFLEFKNRTSIFGQHLLPTEEASNSSSFGIKFSKTASKSSDPIVKFSYAGIGGYIYGQNKSKKPFSVFNKIKSMGATTYTSNQVPKKGALSLVIKDVKEEINKMTTYDIKMFRFLDGDFMRFTGFNDKEELNTNTATHHYVADVIAISQFALIEILLKKLTLDHGLNQWFTPVIRYAKGFLKNITDIGRLVDKEISKLVYIRLREVSNKQESTIFAFNGDTYGFVADFSQDASRLAIGNLNRTYTKEASNAVPDIFSEIFASITFPQKAPGTTIDNEGDIVDLPFSVINLSLAAEERSKLTSAIKSQKEIYDDLMEKFTDDYAPNNDLSNDDIGIFYQTLMKQSADYGIFMQNVLSSDDKLISFIKGVPASYMRADIYTGSKFNTMQYDSLAITRLIQLLASSMSGFPVTNNPQTNTEKGKIDSYPIFSANRMVIRPKVYFGVRDAQNEKHREFFYKLYPSLTELFAKEGYNDQGRATCFLVLDVAHKQLKSEDDDPDFIFPMEDIQDFGMIKASTVNHMFNFSINDHMKDFTLFKNIEFEKNPDNTLFQNTIQNGLFIEYVEGGITSFGFSPPEHQHLKLEDLTQNREYNSWKNRCEPSSNTEYTNDSKPVYNPRTLYTQKIDKTIGKFIVNNYDDWKNPKLVYLYKINSESESSTETIISGFLRFQSGATPNEKDGYVLDDYPEVTTKPFFGTTTFINISDIKAEFKALELILTNDDINYRDISNVDQELMDNIRIRSPFMFEYNDGDNVKYKDRITFNKPSSGKVFDSTSLSEVIININKQLNKINIREMMWLFPYTGYNINNIGELIEVGLDAGYGTSDVWRKHLLLVVYLDLLVKGIRYVLWSLAKARFFAHVYLPIEYKKYSKYPRDGINYAGETVEPGSSVRIQYNKDNSLFKTIDAPLVVFPIKGLEKGKNAYLPLYRSISRGNEMTGTGKTARLENTSSSARKMTWYVSKKVTYLGGDGALMRVEMTEGSLDWTLFYNEKNLLTQVSEHYLLNGLGNFRTGVF